MNGSHVNQGYIEKMMDDSICTFQTKILSELCDDMGDTLTSAV